jgi:uncharacterized protein (TIGR00369 family)
MTDANEWFLDNHDYLGDLGITVADQREGYVCLSLPHDDSLTNPGSDVMQGGVVATLIDHAGGAAIRTTLDEPLETDHASTELNVSFVQPADGDLTAEAEVVRVGGSMGVVEVEVTTGVGEDERTVAVGRVSLFLDRG